MKERRKRMVTEEHDCPNLQITPVEQCHHRDCREPSPEEIEREDFKLRSECYGCAYFEEFKTKRPDEPSWFGCKQGNWSGYLVGDKAPCGKVAFTPAYVTPKVAKDD